MITQKIRFCQTPDGSQIAYSIAGKGPPLIMTANWLGHIEYEWECLVWRHWYKSLTKHFTLVRYDQRGCGLSDWDVNSITFESWVHDLETVVKAAGFKRFSMLGLFQGGAVAVSYAERHPV